MQPNLDKLNFYSGVNYMKRSDKSGHQPLNIGAANTIQTMTIDHNLGYAPQFDFYVDLLNDGTYWYGGEIVHEGTESTSGGGSYPFAEVNGFVTLTQFIAKSSNPTGGTIGNREVYWLIYLDYGV